MDPITQASDLTRAAGDPTDAGGRGEAVGARWVSGCLVGGDLPADRFEHGFNPADSPGVHSVGLVGEDGALLAVTALDRMHNIGLFRLCRWAVDRRGGPAATPWFALPAVVGSLPAWGCARATVNGGAASLEVLVDGDPRLLRVPLDEEDSGDLSAPFLAECASTDGDRVPLLGIGVDPAAARLTASGPTRIRLRRLTRARARRLRDGVRLLLGDDPLGGVAASVGTLDTLLMRREGAGIAVELGHGDVVAVGALSFEEVGGFLAALRPEDWP